MGVEVSAAAESATARVAVSASGGVPATPLYVLRRDANGTTLVRQTSDGATQWAAGSALRTNYALNPSFEVDTATARPEGNCTLARSTAQAAVGAASLEVTATAAGDVSVSLLRGAGEYPVVVAGETWTAQQRFRAAATGRAARVELYWVDSAGAVVGSETVGAQVTDATTGWTTATVTGTAPAGAMQLFVNFRVLGCAASEVHYVDAVLVEKSATVDPYFDGTTAADTAVTPTRYHRWTGTAHASTSEAYTTTSPVVYDYEARQGLETDFIVTDQDGAALASVRISLPAWGTWLKDPGAPHRNLKVLWKGDDDYTRAGQRDLIRPRGAKFPIALADRRAAPVGQVALATVTDEEARSMTTLLDSGQVLMIDVDARFGVPVRYVSIGDVTGSRASSGIFASERFWSLQVDEVAAPIGIAAGQGFTYLGIPPLADSYVALAAIFATYDDLAIGQQTA